MTIIWLQLNYGSTGYITLPSQLVYVNMALDKGGIINTVYITHILLAFVSFTHYQVDSVFGRLLTYNSERSL